MIAKNACHPSAGETNGRCLRARARGPVDGGLSFNAGLLRRTQQSQQILLLLRYTSSDGRGDADGRA